VDIPSWYEKIPLLFRYVTGDFNLSTSHVTTLEGAPSYVGGDFKCCNTITSLIGSPNHVGRDFACGSSSIATLEGAPSYVGEDFLCNRTAIKSLTHAPKYIGARLWVPTAKISTLHNIHKTHQGWVVNVLAVPETCTHLLGLAFLPGVKFIQIGINQSNRVEVIHDVHEWQEKLLELGLTEQAQL
jgi:hypothetical protein